MYEAIVLGATFTAAGIAEVLGKNCLVLERRAQAGYEFFGALRFTENEPKLYASFQNARILFGTRIVSVTNTENEFECTCWGANGLCTYQAKRVVDTRCTDKDCVAKTYNLLVESREEPVFENARCEKTKAENRYLVTCPVPVFSTYPEARNAAGRILSRFSPSQRLILSANEFDYSVKGEYPRIKDGVVHLPSKLFDTPDLARDAGISLGKEWKK